MNDLINGDSWLGTFIIIFALAIVVLLIVSMWKVFKKAGYEGWEAIIPFII